MRELHFIDKQYQQSWANDRGELRLESKAAVDATPAPAMRLSPPLHEDTPADYPSSSPQDNGSLHD